MSDRAHEHVDRLTISIGQVDSMTFENLERQKDQRSFSVFVPIMFDVQIVG